MSNEHLEGATKKPKFSLRRLKSEGRRPVVIDGWASPLLEIPPMGAKPGEQLINEQVGEWPSGYGDIETLTPRQARKLKKKIKDVFGE